MQQKKSIKTRYLWMIFVLSLVAGVFLILWVQKSGSNTLPLILMVIDFVIMTMAINTAIARTFRYKPRPKKFVVKKYTGLNSKELDSKLLSLGFNRKSVRFGHGYIKIIGDTAYKIVAIDDCDKYFTTADNIAKDAQEEKPTPGIDKCTKFIGFEIFFKTNEEVKSKIVDFSFQGKNIYYNGIYFDAEEQIFVEANHVKPKDVYLEGYEKMLEMIEFKSYVEPVEETNKN